MKREEKKVLIKTNKKDHGGRELTQTLLRSDLILKNSLIPNSEKNNYI